MTSATSPTDREQIRLASKGGRVAPHDVLTGFYREPDARAGFVRQLFDRTAGHYNWICGAMSFGTDRQYRKYALRRAGLRPGMKLLDVATGTGLVACAALDLGLAAPDLVGLDPSRGMLEENRKGQGIPLVQGFGERLPFRDATFDFVTMGYALRHVEDVTELFGEFHRVLRPMGRALVLEITRPATRIGSLAMQFYMRRIVPWVMRLRTSDREAVRLVEYYWATIAECVPPPTILRALADAGFRDVQRKTCGSLLSDYVAVRA